MKERFGESAGDSYISVTKKKEQALKECEKQFNRAMSDKEPSYTYWTTIAYNDDNEFAVVMCYLDKESAESYGYDGEADFAQAKFAYRPNNSVMGEYEWDWLMPYPINEYGDTLDTDMPIGSPSDFSWILDEAYSFIDKFNADLPTDDDWDDFGDEDSDLYEGCHGGKKKSKKKVLNQKKVCGEDAKRTKNGVTFFIDDNAKPEVVRKGLVDYTLDGYVDMGDFDAPCKVGFYDGEDEPVYIFVDGGVTDDGYHYEKDTIALESYVREERTYDLTPQKRDSRKSFYGKAKVVDKGNGEYELISYNTPVACVKDGKVVYADLRKYSVTTDRHIREFLAQFCDEC